MKPILSISKTGFHSFLIDIGSTLTMRRLPETEIIFGYAEAFSTKCAPKCNISLRICLAGFRRYFPLFPGPWAFSMSSKLSYIHQSPEMKTFPESMEYAPHHMPNLSYIRRGARSTNHSGSNPDGTLSLCMLDYDIKYMFQSPYLLARLKAYTYIISFSSRLWKCARLT
jgi:hypothetical protein